MARWATVCIIAGVDYSACRTKIIDPGGLQSPFAGSSETSNSGNPNVQTINRGVASVKFGIKMARALESNISSTISAIQTAQGLGQTIRVQISDGIYVVDIDGTVDYDQEAWLTHGEFSEGVYEDLIWRFIAKQNHS